MGTFADRGTVGKINSAYNSSFRLSPQQLQEIKCVFDLFDTKFDGTIDVSNLGIAMRGLGLLASEAHIMRLAEAMDSKDSPTGRIDLSTFLIFMAREFRQHGSDENKQKKKIEDAFRKAFNKKNNTKIPIVAFRSALTNSGEKLTDEEVDDVIRKAGVTDAEVDLTNVCNEILNTAPSLRLNTTMSLS